METEFKYIDKNLYKDKGYVSSTTEFYPHNHVINSLKLRMEMEKIRQLKRIADALTQNSKKEAKE